ncbi:coiled-coil domain-containing protein 86-like [Biomphalaria glabrata]|uniref:Coiled-coil domain-containing protein 86 n=1 Tax=Biomphalaria glabrata TaxID=6526 RepID=A0A9W2YGW3_BIOGL|nr:coiled-coil domain-containing protein 86-like [Biomphalaria glabrata]KAI8753697.1 coiled-coil domain-containing protein 86-like [Biomphalaria glabrata]
MSTNAHESVSSEDSVKKIFHEIPRGKPKSGRVWKTVRTERFSKIKQDKMFTTSWAKKMSLREEKKRLKEMQEQLKTDKDKEKQLRRERIEANKKRKLENQRRSEIVQPIRNTAKIKKMKKKQLRMIETR